MKKILSVLTALCLIPCFLCPAAAAEVRHVVVSFYPLYIFAMNVIGDVPDVTLSGLSSNQSGCLHDYQLVTGDMVILSGADLFLINGAGMESFLEDAARAFPDLRTVSCSDGISLIRNDEGAETEYNAHVWLNPRNAVIMVRNICSALCELLPESAGQFEENAEAYIARLNDLDDRLKNGLSVLEKRDIVTFHEAFPYFAEAYGLNIIAVIALEPDEGISPRMLAELADRVVRAGCPPLFTEPQYRSDAALALSAETGASVWELDPAVTGPLERDAYEKAMLGNMEVLLEALNGKP